MTDSKTPTAGTPKQKRVRHAGAQASYMERKRAEGKEWLAVWVPGEARDTFRALAKRSVEDSSTPTEAEISSLEQAIGEKAPKWAKGNQTLLNLWGVSFEKNTLKSSPKSEEKASDKKENTGSEKKKDKKKKKKKK